MENNDLMVFASDYGKVTARPMRGTFIGRKHDCTRSSLENEAMVRAGNFMPGENLSGQELYEELVRQLKLEVRIRSMRSVGPSAQPDWVEHDEVHALAYQNKCWACNAQPNEQCRDMRSYRPADKRYNKHPHPSRLKAGIKKADKLGLLANTPPEDGTLYEIKDQTAQVAAFLTITMQYLFPERKD